MRKGKRLKMVYVLDMLNVFLGIKGIMVSTSKSCGPAMAVYNANLVVNGFVLWHGDIDLEASRRTLCSIAKMFDITIEVYYESSLRVFPFEVQKKKDKNVSKKEIDKRIELKQTKLLKKANPVYTTAAPDKFNGEDFEEALAVARVNRDELIKLRRIGYGFLTPNGTEWNRFNTIYYNGPHRIFRCIRYFFRTFIEYPYSYYSISKREGKPFFARIKKVVEMFFKEIEYHREIFKGNKVISLSKYLFDH